jgi:AcrR family transcriptional regulator
MPAGRRPGRSNTQHKLLTAARRQFAEHGYERASLRAIARAARVDQRLITHFFGSKHGIFVAAMALPVDPADFVAAVAAPGIEGFGERLARRWVALWDSAEGRHLVGLLRSAVSNEAAARMMRDVFVHVVLRQLVRALDVDQVDQRANFVASQLFGLALVRYVLRLRPVATMSVEEIARWVGPTIQRYLEEPLPRDRTAQAIVFTGRPSASRSSIPPARR